MTHRNPFFPLRHTGLVGRFLDADIEELVERLRSHFPDLVIFSNVLHNFRYDAEETYCKAPAKVWKSPAEYWEGRQQIPDFDGTGMILRVPWPEDIRSGDPERLIGGRIRRLYDASPKEFRRFGRVIYLGGGIDENLVSMNREAVAELLGIPLSSVPEIRFFKNHLNRSSVGLLYNNDDPDMLEFIKIVRFCMRGLTTSVGGTYDIMTGEPLSTYPTRMDSLRLQRRCSLEENLYIGPNAYRFDGRISFLGPSPRLRQKWRQEAGLAPDFKTKLRDIKRWTHRSLREERRPIASMRLPTSIDPYTPIGIGVTREIIEAHARDAAALRAADEPAK